MTQRQPNPIEVLTEFVIAVLAPMFITASGGDIQTARLAACATIQDFRAETNASLITVAKIVSFGLGTLSALSLALTQDAGLPMLLRLQSSAAACDRAEHRNRRVLQQQHRAPPPQPDPPECDQAETVARAEQAAALVRQVRLQQAGETTRPPAPAAPAEPPQPPKAPPRQPAAPKAPAEQRQAPNAPAQQPVPGIDRTIWATAFATAAQDFAAEIPNLPPAERWAASVRSQALSSAATDLLNGLDLAQFRLKT